MYATIPKGLAGDLLPPEMFSQLHPTTGAGAARCFMPICIGPCCLSPRTSLLDCRSGLVLSITVPLTLLDSRRLRGTLSASHRHRLSFAAPLVPVDFFQLRPAQIAGAHHDARRNTCWITTDAELWPDRRGQASSVYNPRELGSEAAAAAHLFARPPPKHPSNQTSH